MRQTTATPSSRLDPEPVARRDFLGIASLASMLSAMLLAGIGMLRLPKAAVLPSASKKFSVQLPESLPLGSPYVPPGRNVAVFRDAKGVYAMSLVCTHLGCIVKQAPDGFECPCHGSRFAPDGSVSKGPAPKSLPCLRITAAGDKFIVDEEVSVPADTRVQA